MFNKKTTVYSGLLVVLLAFFASKAVAEPGYRVCVSNDNNYFIKIKKSKSCPTSDGYKSKKLTCESFTRTYTRWGEWNVCPGIPSTAIVEHGHGAWNPTRNGNKHPKANNLDYELHEFTPEWVTKRHFVYGPLCEKNGTCSVSFNIGQTSAVKAGIKFKNKHIPWAEIDASYSRSFKNGISVSCSPNEGYEAKLELLDRNNKYSFKDFEKRGGIKCHFELAGKYEEAEEKSKQCNKRYPILFQFNKYKSCMGSHIRYLL